MQKVLEEIWYGNLYPSEQITQQNEEIKKLDFLIFRNKENILSTLNDEQKITFEKYEQCLEEKNDILYREIFTFGFRLGGKLMLETLVGND